MEKINTARFYDLITFDKREERGVENALRNPRELDSFISDEDTRQVDSSLMGASEL